MASWNIAQVKISQTEARSILGSPHYIENDPRATAGGVEDHWTYLSCDGLPVFFRMRVPYELMDICLTRSSLTQAETSWLQSLFEIQTICYLDEPLAEN